MSSAAPPPRRRFGRRTKTFRRVSGGLALMFALSLAGLVYSAFAPQPQAAVAAEADAESIAAGKVLYDNSCITCHGANLEGVEGRGVPLIGIGSAATYFQVATGRMPAADNGAQMPRRAAFFTQEEIKQLGDYVQSIGGGAQIPEGSLRNDAAIAKGAELYRLNCASCHNFTGKGGALSQGKFAPDLGPATDEDIYSAMLSGPENMPKFSDGQLSPDDKRAIVSYVQNAKVTADPGGYGLGGFGPVSEGLIAFIVGMGLIVSVTLWMGARA